MMAYSFMSTGGSGEAYDVMAEDVNSQLYFAGEVSGKLSSLEKWLRKSNVMFIFICIVFCCNIKHFVYFGIGFWNFIRYN